MNQSLWAGLYNRSPKSNSIDPTTTLDTDMKRDHMYNV